MRGFSIGREARNSSWSYDTTSGDLSGIARRGRPAQAAGNATHRGADASSARVGAQDPFDARLRSDRRGRRVKLVAGDMRVAVHGRQIGVAQVLGDQARVAGGAAQPGGRRVAQGVGGDGLCEPGARGAAADDRGQDRGLQAAALQAAEDWVARAWVRAGTQGGSSPASAGASGWRRACSPLPQRTRREGRGPSRSRSPSRAR